MIRSLWDDQFSFAKYRFLSALVYVWYRIVSRKRNLDRALVEIDLSGEAAVIVATLAAPAVLATGEGERFLLGTYRTSSLGKI
ncbi:hypothetical protein HDU96_004658 [Phlyctochytrium bullatum]|nr:hypothetical protein HDU96_004658 [Phlyctochytrium bullatum]